MLAHMCEARSFGEPQEFGAHVLEKSSRVCEAHSLGFRWHQTSVMFLYEHLLY